MDSRIRGNDGWGFINLQVPNSFPWGLDQGFAVESTGRAK
jgi:hypothetical protein